MTDSINTGIIGMPDSNVMQAMSAFADTICDAKFIRPEIRGDKSTIMFLLCIGQDLGLPWTTAMRLIYPLVKYTAGKNGGPAEMMVTGVGIEGKAVAALLLKNGFQIDFPVSTDEEAQCLLTRPDGKQAPLESFTFKQAQAGNMTQDRNGNVKIPYNLGNRRNQLRWRALGRVANIYAADVLQGVYVTEELLDYETAQLNEGETGSMPEPENYTVGEIEAAPEPLSAATAQAEPVVVGTPATATEQAPADAPRRRGRPPGSTTSKPAPPAAAPTPAPAPAAEPAASPTPTSAPPPAAQSKAADSDDAIIKANLGMAISEFNKVTSLNTGRDVLVEFARGYLGVPRPPSAMSAWAPIFDAFMASLANDRELLCADPKQAGYEAKHGSVLKATLAEWGWVPEAVAAASKFAVSFYPGKAESFLAWMRVIKMHELGRTLPVSDVVAFFTAAEISKESAVDMLEASQLPYCLDSADSGSGTFEQLFNLIVSSTKKPMEELDKADLDAAAKMTLEALIKANDRYVAEKQAAEAPGADGVTASPAAPAADDSDIASLFGEG